MKQHHVSGNPARPLVKACITAALILALLIPTWFISNLVDERQARQAEVVNDVCSKWALAQTITGPYLYIPYRETTKDYKGNEQASIKSFILLPDDLSVNGTMQPEQRPRSIYKVLLYRSTIGERGNFVFQLPRDVDPASLQLADARVCIGVTDFRGIEKKVDINLNGKSYNLLPGLPSNDIDASGLSAAIDLSPADLGKSISFELPLQLRGSQQLHFVPLAGNSQFKLQSSWPNPSFDGTSIPAERTVSDSGFSAQWVFNKANLPFTTIVKPGAVQKTGLRFGVSMLQPADQYAKTSRSVKYAILIIGLSFSLFFIIELMQKKPMHPVQYVLIGLALVIFYTLLLSISEFLLFDKAYLIAAAATVLLIATYAKSHFGSLRTAAVFGLLLSALYAFIFVLIRLEDTALLIGSIGLFIILALVMYVSRRINWYQTPGPDTALQVSDL